MARRLSLHAAALAAICLSGAALAADFKDPAHKIQHVLLISVDGLHGKDIANSLKLMPDLNVAKLAAKSLVFSNAMTPIPSDSFPGLLAQLTGGTSRSHGMVYDDAYDAALSEPGSDCKTVGAEVVLDESVDKNPDAIDGGGGLDEKKLPRDPKAGCVALMPHQLVRANTIFEVIKAAGGRTAWADKHLAYDIVNGPSGKGVDDLFVPEINAGGATDSVAKTIAYDDIKVAAVLNQIAGKDHAGKDGAGVPTILGMNFQAVSVGQKTTGYLDAVGMPTPDLKTAFEHTDASIGKMFAALKAAKIADKTLVIISAKHGQAPIDPTKRKIVDGKAFDAFVKAAAPSGVGNITRDSVALIWLKDHKDTAAVVKALDGAKEQFSIESVVSGEAMRPWFNDPSSDSRAPDIYVQPIEGVIYTKPSATKTAEHGGGSESDRHVALVIAGPGVAAATIDEPVTTMQIAPTILEALGLDPMSLAAVKGEGTKALPGLKF